jgi:hypothetical protein
VTTRPSRRHIQERKLRAPVRRNQQERAQLTPRTRHSNEKIALADLPHFVILIKSELEDRLADARVSDLLVWFLSDPRSGRFHGCNPIHLPAVLREGPATAKHRIVDGVSSRPRATGTSDNSVPHPRPRHSSRVAVLEAVKMRRRGGAAQVLRDGCERCLPSYISRWPNFATLSKSTAHRISVRQNQRSLRTRISPKYTDCQF